MLQKCLTPTINDDSKFSCLEVGVLGAPCAWLLKVVGKFLVWHLKIELKSRVTPEEWGGPEITGLRQGYWPILLNLHDLDSGVANPRDLASRKWKGTDMLVYILMLVYPWSSDFMALWSVSQECRHSSSQSHIQFSPIFHGKKNCRGRRACIASINFTSNLEIIPMSLAFTYVWQY
jgi:hypothetical protein